MKVSSTSSTSATAGGGAKPAAEGFSRLLAADGVAPRAAAAGVSGAAGVSAIARYARAAACSTHSIACSWPCWAKAHHSAILRFFKAPCLNNATPPAISALMIR